MDVIQDLGELALATRLRRLADRLSQDVAHLYAARGLDLEPRWFPVVWTLSANGPQTAAEISRGLGLSETAVGQVVAALQRKGLVARGSDPADTRRQPLDLTPAGVDAVINARPLWAAIRAATGDLLDESCAPLLDRLASVEQALDRVPLMARLRRHLRFEADEVEIADYRPAFRKHFERLNRRWIEEVFEMEPEDERLLSNPNRHIIRRGGDILFALVNREVVGTVALLNQEAGTVEMAKMAVAPPWQGLGIGRRLAEAALDRARRRHADRVTLLTSPRLRRAMVLYLSLGFTAKTDQQHAQRMARPSLVMELSLKP